MIKDNSENKISKRRAFALIALIAFVFGIYAFRLFQIQIVEGDEYKQIANRNTTSTVSIAASRGEILDRNLRPLAINRTSFSVLFDYAFFPRGNEEEQRKQQNDIILSLTDLLSEAGEEWNDNLPISRTEPYTFAEGEETRIAGLKKLLKLADYATAEQCMKALIERYKLENYDAADQRTAAGVQYEMDVRDFTISNPFEFSSDISRDTMYKIRENSQKYTGVDVQTAPVREYVSGTLAPHLIGVVGPIYEDEFKELKEQGYRLNDTLGKSGIEAAMESVLRGKTGTTTVVKNAAGTVIDKRETEAPVPGDSVILTLDSHLQEAAQNALDKKIQELRQLPETENGEFANNGHDVRSGAVVVLDAKNGGVLACATWPTYDLSTYYTNYAELLADPDKPLFNRALNGGFAIGSTMKPLVALAALTEGTITPTDKINCVKEYSYYKPSVYCMGRHGNIDVVTALKRSCNYFFYDVGRMLGIEPMNAYSTMFGLGQKTGIEVGESAGVMDSPDYRATFGQQWMPGTTIQYAIGQADNLFTPIQLAAYAMALANDGVRYKTHLVHSIRTYDGKETLIEPEIAAEVPLSQLAIDTVRQGMIEVVKTNGTAASFFNNVTYTLAAKTGTAQITADRSDHGTFIAYAPVEDPEIAISVVMEDGTSHAASAVAREVMDAYFNNKGDGLKPVPDGELLP